MPVIFGPYFINAETFEEASGVWTDAALTTCAPSGYYSNGVIQRYLSNQSAPGVPICCLGPALECPTCVPPQLECGIGDLTDGGPGELYDEIVSLGTGTGVALVGLIPSNIPDGLAVQFPQGGTILSSGSTQFGGFASNNYNGGSTDLKDHLCWIGNARMIDGAWIGISTALGVGCGNFGNDNINWDCVGAPPPQTDFNGGAGFTRFMWDPVALAWVPDPVAGPASIEISNYCIMTNACSNTSTQLGVMGLDEAGVCQPHTNPTDPCEFRTGYFFIPITKTSFQNQNFRLMLGGATASNTGFSFTLICPKPPTPFQMSDLIAESNTASYTPNGFSGYDSETWPNTLYQVSVWDDAQTALAYPNQPAGAFGTIQVDPNVATNYGNGILGQHCFAYQTADGTGLRWNEGAPGGFKYQWYRVNLVTGGPNALKAITLSCTAAVNPAQEVLWQEAEENTGALIQIDDHGIITRIVLLNLGG